MGLITVAAMVDGLWGQLSVLRVPARGLPMGKKECSSSPVVIHSKATRPRYGYCTENSSLSWGMSGQKTKEKTRKDAVSVWPPQGLEAGRQRRLERQRVHTEDIVHFLSMLTGWKRWAGIHENAAGMTRLHTQEG